MICRNIKDLSIALEALTRVPRTEELSSAVEQLLVHEIDLKHKENNPLKTTRIQDDDEIPF